MDIVLKKTIGIGAGGHSKVVIDILRFEKQLEIVGLLDNNLKLKGKKIHGFPVLGNDNLIDELIQNSISHFFIGIGSVGNTSNRQKIFDFVAKKNLKPINAIHPKTSISSSVNYKNGVTIMANVVMNADVQLGSNVIVNTGTIIEHDCEIGNHVHISTGARVAGGVIVQDGVHLGIGAIVKENIHIGAKAIIGAGAVVIDNVPSNVTVIGNPARIIKQDIDV